MGGLRGGGKRGGKGSLPRYLLDQKVPPKIVIKMVSIILMFNYIPDKDIFREAMLLFHDEFSDYLNDHVKSNYLKPDEPWKLGGRTAGLQGQVGSNNGVISEGVYGRTISVA